MDTILSAQCTTTILMGEVSHLGKWQMIGTREKKLLTEDIHVCDVSDKGERRTNECKGGYVQVKQISAIINFYHQSIKSKSITI